MKKNWNYTALVVGFTICLGCEDVIDIQTDDAPTQITVDAWINNLPSDQFIRLTESQPYFENEFTPGIQGAEITITSESGQIYEFLDQNNGDYIWSRPTDSVFGMVGETYLLQVSVNDQTLVSQAKMSATAQVDRIEQEFRTDELGGPDGIYAEFFARDLPGLGDTYWIKTFKNEMFLNKPEEINIAYDGGFDAGAEIDGITFIPPIRELVNPFPDSSETDLPRYDTDDQIRVEIHSISLEAFLFLESARDQILNGSNTIFASPIANSPGNVISTDARTEVLGVFCVSAVSSLEKKIE